MGNPKNGTGIRYDQKSTFNFTDSRTTFDVLTERKRPKEVHYAFQAFKADSLSPSFCFTSH